MNLYKEELELFSHSGKTTYLDITKQVNEVIKNSKIEEGMVTVISPHTTCSVFFEEFTPDINEDGDESLQEELNNVLRKIIPDHDSASTYVYPGEKHYEMVGKWPNVDEYIPDGDKSALWNGDAHLKATIIGSSETFEVTGNKLGVGKTGYVYFADFDRTRERQRTCKVIVIGK